jgi:biopolymer transport protein ExbD
MRMKRRKRKVGILVPIVSMGDIAFLLIIFFMLASNFVKEAHVELDKARSPDIENMSESKVSVKVDKDGSVWLQGEPCPVGLLESGVQALVDGMEDKTVTLTIDKDLSHDVYGDVMLELSKAGAEIALVGIKDEE